MQNQDGIWIVIVALAIALPIIGYFVARYLKGSIYINLPATSFVSGQLINGSFILKTRKPIKANRLLVALVGYEKHRRRRSDGKVETHRHENYRDERQLNCKPEYPAGIEENYEFELAVPARNQADSSEITQVISVLTSALGNPSTQEWEVQVTLDAQGVDLSSRRRIFLNF